MIKKLQKLDTKTQFLDLCTFRYLCNNRKLFLNTKAKSIDFIIAVGQIIQTEKIGTMTIPLAESSTIELHNIVLALGCNFNLILMGQICKSGILYHNNPTIMILMRNRKIIIEAKRERKLFMLNLIHSGKTMVIINP